MWLISLCVEQLIDESPTKEAQLKSWLWTFLDVNGIQPTNNAS